MTISPRQSQPINVKSDHFEAKPRDSFEPREDVTPRMYRRLEQKYDLVWAATKYPYTLAYQTNIVEGAYQGGGNLRLLIYSG